MWSLVCVNRSMSTQNTKLLRSQIISITEVDVEMVPHAPKKNRFGSRHFALLDHHISLFDNYSGDLVLPNSPATT